MEYPISISTLNDFIFCPISIYFHEQIADLDTMLYQDKAQLDGTNAHRAIDNKKYSTSNNILQSMSVYSEKYGLIGKIDTFDLSTGILVERKKHITKIYDGYIFQLYAQYFSLIEMGYEVRRLRIYSYDDNKNYEIDLPESNPEMLLQFETLINKIKSFNLSKYVPDNKEKCSKCIYYTICDRGL